MSDEQPTPQQDFVPSTPPPPPIVSGTVSESTAARPAAVTAIGVILLVLAGLNLIALAGGLFTLAMGTSPMYPSWFLIFSLCVNVLLLPAALVSGIGLLRLRRWARTGAILTLVARLLLGVAINVTSYFVVIMPATPGVGGNFMPIIKSVSLVIGLLVTVAINSVMIYFLMRPEVVAAFEGTDGLTK